MSPAKPMSVDVSANWASERTLSPLEQAYNFILESILSGELAPGMRIPTEAVAERLGISRMPVRDALRRLEGDGAITIYANRGATVAEYSKDEVIQLVEMRAVLEGLGARLAIPNVTQRELEEIRHLQSRMDRSADDLGQWIVHHDAFHNYITSLSGRPLLTRQTKKMRLMLRPYFREHHAANHELEIPGFEHQRIIDVLIGGQPDEVEQEVRNHGMANVGKVTKLMDR
ncbi:GntR family transcriptional regulator [Bradyrhizobium sp. SYSU BS000235]|uniref:GntR family transcriptional regulator n=1 Tax=Bradyrhizobium sp. SYSU BS000235 TaxID=3411332 RepID=UPI003C71B823